eukprot:gene8089-7459_t
MSTLPPSTQAMAGLLDKPNGSAENYIKEANEVYLQRSLTYQRFTELYAEVSARQAELTRLREQLEREHE